jgi:hypothetical protein
MATLLKSAKMIVLCGVLGAMAYQVQHYCLNEVLSQLHIRRHWHLAVAYDVWPLGAVLGVLTGAALAAARMERPQVAARICMVGGSLAAACLMDAFALLCWWFDWRIDDYGYVWTTTETLLGLIPVIAFGLLWSLLLMLSGWRLRQRPTAE